MIQRKIQSQDGMATLIALLLVGMLMLIGLAAISTSDDEVTIAGNELQEMRAFYAAEAGLECAVVAMESEFDSTGMPPLVLPTGKDEVNQCNVSYMTSDEGPASSKIISTGALSGFHSFTKSYTVTSKAESQVDNASVQLSQAFDVCLVPIFQWAVFFNEDMWAQPIFDMNIDGRTHVNGDMYLQSSGSGKTLTFEDRVTSGGNIYAGFPYGSGQVGDVAFTDNDGNTVSMKQGGDWIDADRADWYDTAASLWRGNVQDKAFGQKPLNLPLTNNDDPHKIIERSTGNPDSYQNKSDFQVIDGVPYAKISGVFQDVSSYLPAGTITSDGTTNFYDAHEKNNVQNTQIDIDKLKSSGYFPVNGIIYVSDQRSSGSDLNGATLVNGQELGRPLTVVCENPLYVQGDYNTKNKQPAATISDAITFLSNNWDPAMSSAQYTSRNATKTEVNLCIMTGDIEPVNGNYGGGLENLPRFLENWKGAEFKVRGSMIEMWRSQQAKEAWRYPPAYDAYYTAPTRNWGFDTDLSDPNKLPPATPAIRVFQRSGWRQHDIAYTGIYKRY